MNRFGISAALLTPFSADGTIDLDRLEKHTKGLLNRGVSSVTLFGTTGEGASIGFDERAEVIGAMTSSEIDPGRVKICICATSVADAAAQLEQGLSNGVFEFLLVPPFYFADSHDDGLFEWHRDLFRHIDTRARIILYHIPQVTGVALSQGLVDRLVASHPERVIAIKDSSGDWSYAERQLKSGRIAVLVGDERLLHRSAKLGGAGAISGIANLYPERMLRLFESGVEDRELSNEVNKIVSLPVIPSLKVRLGLLCGDPEWERVRPPQVRLTLDQRSRLGDALNKERRVSG